MRSVSTWSGARIASRIITWYVVSYAGWPPGSDQDIVGMSRRMYQQICITTVPLLFILFLLVLYDTSVPS